MKRNKSVEKKDILKTPICDIENIIKKKIFDVNGSLNEGDIFNSTNITEVFNGELLDTLTIEIQKEFGVELSSQDFEYCQCFFDLVVLVKRKLNTLRMMRTPAQYDWLNVPQIPHYTSDYRDSRNKLVNISPFNDIFCRSCLYNVFYSSLSHFGIAPFWFFSDEIFCYSFSNNTLHINTVENSDSRLLPNYGIDIAKLSVHNSIIHEIKNIIDEDKPVVSAVDTFYIPSRKDTYLSDHTSHYILIFGYDDNQQTFDIVEHDYFYDLKYKKTKLHYQDFFNSFYSYFKWFDEPQLLIVSQLQKCPQYTSDDIRTEYIEFYKACKKEILNGYKAINEFKKYYVTLMENETLFWDNLNNVLKCIDTCIQRKFTEEYLYGLIFAETNIYELQIKVRRSWQKLGMMLRMIKSRGKISLEAASKHEMLFEHIIEYEIERSMLIFDFCEDNC